MKPLRRVAALLPWLVVPTRSGSSVNIMGFEVYQPRGTTDWTWRLVAADAIIVARGMMYTSLPQCLEAIRLVKGTNDVTPVFDGDTGDLIPYA